MLGNEIIKCPHCGDTKEGYRYIVIHKYTQIQGWGNNPAEADSDSGVGMDYCRNQACRCNNCNKIIKRQGVDDEARLRTIS